MQIDLRVCHPHNRIDHVEGEDVRGPIGERKSRAELCMLPSSSQIRLARRIRDRIAEERRHVVTSLRSLQRLLGWSQGYKREGVGKRNVMIVNIPEVIKNGEEGVEARCVSLTPRGL